MILFHKDAPAPSSASHAYSKYSQITLVFFHQDSL